MDPKHGILNYFKLFFDIVFYLFLWNRLLNWLHILTCTSGVYWHLIRLYLIEINLIHPGFFWIDALRQILSVFANFYMVKNGQNLFKNPGLMGYSSLAVYSHGI